MDLVNTYRSSSPSLVQNRPSSALLKPQVALPVGEVYRLVRCAVPLRKHPVRDQRRLGPYLNPMRCVDRLGVDLRVRPGSAEHPGVVPARGGPGVRVRESSDVDRSGRLYRRSEQTVKKSCQADTEPSPHRPHGQRPSGDRREYRARPVVYRALHSISDADITTTTMDRIRRSMAERPSRRAQIVDLETCIIVYIYSCQVKVQRTSLRTH